MRQFAFTAALGLTITSIATLTPSPMEAAPNIVIFLADDLGYGDLGCFGHPIIRSPNLDRFASEGVRLTQCYAASAVCSPSRSAIQTGRTPYRNGVFTWIPENQPIHLRTSELALPRLLKQVGYTSAHVGKWHLNSHFNKPTQPQPNDHGYDWWLATQNNAAPSHAQPDNFVRNGVRIGKVEDYSAIHIVKEALGWLQNERDKSKPFLLTVWSHEPHYPIASAPEFKAQYPNISDPVQLEHHANVTQLDHAFGLLMQGLRDQNLESETIVFFTSDNGPEGDGVKSPGRGSTGGLRGRKRSVYEGGIRVPGIVRWPGKIQAGTTSNSPVIGSDIFVTSVNIAKAPLPSDRVLDGGDMQVAWTGGQVERARPLYWRCNIAPEPLKMACRVGDWKILANEKLTDFELYNLSNDVQEKVELSAKEPAKLDEMKSQIIRLNQEIEAEGPSWWRDYQTGKKADAPKEKKAKRKAK